MPMPPAGAARAAHRLGHPPPPDVPIEVLLRFNKLKELTSSAEEVIAAVAESDVVVVSDDKASLRRKAPLAETDDSQDRTIYAVRAADGPARRRRRRACCDAVRRWLVRRSPSRARSQKGIPPSASLDAINKCFAEFGDVEYVTMRRNKDKSFKGSVYVQYAKREHAVAAIDANPVFEGTPLEQVMFM